jgi:hypothetical protein
MYVKIAVANGNNIKGEFTPFFYSDHIYYYEIPGHPQRIRN